MGEVVEEQSPDDSVVVGVGEQQNLDGLEAVGVGEEEEEEEQNPHLVVVEVEEVLLQICRP